MFQVRIIVKLGGKVGELNLFNRDLADLCGIQPGKAGEWLSGCIERLSLVELARIMTELELFTLDDVFDVEIIGTPPPAEGRRERIMKKVEPKRKERKAEEKERRDRKMAEMRRQIEEEVRMELKSSRRKRKQH